MSDLNDLYKEADQMKDEGNLEDAIAKLKELLEKDESHTLSHLALAVLYGRVNQHDDAIRHGERACELDSKDAFNFTAMSVTYQRAWAGTQNQLYIQKAEDAKARADMVQAQG